MLIYQLVFQCLTMSLVKYSVTNYNDIIITGSSHLTGITQSPNDLINSFITRGTDPCTNNTCTPLNFTCSKSVFI